LICGYARAWAHNLLEFDVWLTCPLRRLLYFNRKTSYNIMDTHMILYDSYQYFCWLYDKRFHKTER
jgi:hypothetical protein